MRALVSDVVYVIVSAMSMPGGRGSEKNVEESETSEFDEDKFAMEVRVVELN